MLQPLQKHMPRYGTLCVFYISVEGDTVREDVIAHLRVLRTQGDNELYSTVAIYSFQHDYISLTKKGLDGLPYGKGRAAAGVRYITRRSAEYVYYVGFSPNRHIAQREMQAVEDAMPRKDARVTHTLIVALPVELDQKQRADLTRRYAMTITKGGQSPGIFAVHTDKAHNPHLHCSVPDRAIEFVRDGGKLVDVEIGKSVQKLTGKARERVQAGMHPNATEHLRKMWEDVCNDTLEDFGIDARVDRRTLLEQGIERQAEKHRGPQRDVMHIADTPVDIPHTKSEIVVEEGMSPDELTHHVLQRQEDGLHDLADIQLTPADLVEGALTLNQNLKWLEATQEKIADLKRDAGAAQLRSESYFAEAMSKDNERIHHRNASDRVSDQLKPLLREDGTYKGWRIQAFGLDFKFPKYRRAEELDGERQYQDYLKNEALRLSNRHLADAKQMAEKAEALVADAKARQTELEASVSTYGDDATLEDTKQVIQQGIQQNLSTILPEDIVAMHENGVLTRDQALDTLGLMGATEYATRIELRHEQELEQDP